MKETASIRPALTKPPRFVIMRERKICPRTVSDALFQLCLRGDALLKRLASLLLLLLFLFCAAARAEGGASPLLWRVTDGQGHILYLFGTIHAAEEDIFPLPSPVSEAFEACDQLALELDVTTATLRIMLLPEYSEAMVLPHEDDLANHLSPDTLEAAYAFLEGRGMAPAMLAHFSPMALYSLLEEYIMEDSGLSASAGIDMGLAKQAQERGMDILEIETVEFQFGLLAGFPDELYDEMIRAMATCPVQSARQLALLYQAWRAGNSTLLALLTLTETLGSGPEAEEMYSEYNRAMLTDRNLGMADCAETALSSGHTVFLAVGVAHMLGPDGVVALLRDRGYHTEEIGRGRP